MNRTYEKYRTFDRAFKRLELAFCVLSTLLITLLVTLRIVLKNFFGLSFLWTEELCQHIMVWVACIGGVISVEKHEHVSVDIIYNMLPQKLYPHYRMILAVITTVFLAAFAYLLYLEVVSTKVTARTNVATPWFQMWWVYLGTMMDYGLVTLEYFKATFVLFKENKVKAGVGIKDQDLSKLETI